jgi:hypothetical protein
VLSPAPWLDAPHSCPTVTLDPNLPPPPAWTPTSRRPSSRWAASPSATALRVRAGLAAGLAAAVAAGLAARLAGGLGFTLRAEGRGQGFKGATGGTAGWRNAASSPRASPRPASCPPPDAVAQTKVQAEVAWSFGLIDTRQRHEAEAMQDKVGWGRGGMRGGEREGVLLWGSESEGSWPRGVRGPGWPPRPCLVRCARLDGHAQPAAVSPACDPCSTPLFDCPFDRRLTARSSSSCATSAGARRACCRTASSSSSQTALPSARWRTCGGERRAKRGLGLRASKGVGGAGPATWGQARPRSPAPLTLGNPSLSHPRDEGYDAPDITTQYLNLPEVKADLRARPDITYVSCSPEVGACGGACPARARDCGPLGLAPPHPHPHPTPLSPPHPHPTPPHPHPLPPRWTTPWAMTSEHRQPGAPPTPHPTPPHPTPHPPRSMTPWATTS